MKVEQAIYYRLYDQRLFYVAESDIQVGITAHVYTPTNGRLEVAFKHLEFELWDLNFIFKNPGKYCFIIFEDGLKKVILIITIIA